MSAEPDAPRSAAIPTSADGKYTFVSYKREDKPRASKIVEGLRALGVKVWWDDDLAAGQEWREEIEQHLKKASCEIVLWSSHSVGEEGRFVREEAEVAMRQRIPLVPVRIDDVEIPFGFREVQTVDLLTWDGDPQDQSFSKLASDVRVKLSLPPLKAPPTLREVRVTKPLAIAAIVLLALPAGWQIWRDRRHSTPPLNIVERLKWKLQRDAAFSAADRRFAIDTMRDSTRHDPSLRAAAKAEVLSFLAWRARRPVPFAPCSASVSRAFANELVIATDVDTAAKFLQDTIGRGVHVPGLKADSTNLQRMNLRHADLRAVSFRAACLDSTDFRDAWLQGSSFADSAEGRKTPFVRARLDSANFALAVFRDASFNWACLSKTNFAGAHLEGSTFLHATLSWANFAGAHLRHDGEWQHVDTTTSHAFFVGATGLLPSDTAWLAAHGAVMSGMSYGDWAELRKKATAGSTVPACEHH